MKTAECSNWARQWRQGRSATYFEDFARQDTCEDRHFACGEDGAEGGATEESVRGTLFDKHIIALSEDVARLYCETSVAEIDLPADGMILVK
jgi:hypothetical protein